MIFFLKLINYLLVTNVAYTQIEGCTDIEAYNCEADSVWSTYIFDVGGIMYDNSCNWDWDINSNEAIYIGECEVGPCDGYFNEEADNDVNNPETATKREHISRSVKLTVESLPLSGDSNL